MADRDLNQTAPKQLEYLDLLVDLLHEPRPGSWHPCNPSQNASITNTTFTVARQCLRRRPAVDIPVSTINIIGHQPNPPQPSSNFTREEGNGKNLKEPCHRSLQPPSSSVITATAAAGGGAVVFRRCTPYAPTLSLIDSSLSHSFVAAAGVPPAPVAGSLFSPISSLVSSSSSSFSVLSSHHHQTPVVVVRLANRGGPSEFEQEGEPPVAG